MEKKGPHPRVLVFVALLSLYGAFASDAAPPSGRDQIVTGSKGERQAVETALHLIEAPLRYPVVVIDPEGVPDSEAVRQLDAFTVIEPDGRVRQKIYLNRESQILQSATRTDFYRKVLAAVIVHEATHLVGGSEESARQAESRFFTDLIARGLVPADDGMRYLALLRRRTGPGDRLREPGR
jgi:hypothetical protein